MYKLSVLILPLFLLFGCEKPPIIEKPSAQTLTREANGYYCLMTVLNHSGPKGQIILSGNKVVWFTSVLDMISFTLSPEEPKDIEALYVNDMVGANWDNPGSDNWIDAQQAWFVLGSNRTGGMGMQEAVPFSTKEAAKLFSNEYGGEIHQFSSIPEKYIPTRQ